MEYGWHFVKKDYTLMHDMEGVKVEVGRTYRVDPPLSICERGLHACLKILDALFYALGPVACWVRLDGEILTGYDKLCATERTVLAMGDVSRVLHELGLWYAEEIRPSGLVDPDVETTVINTKRRWLAGEIDDQELQALRGHLNRGYLSWIADSNPLFSTYVIRMVRPGGVIWRKVNQRLETAVRESLGLEPMVRSTSA